MGTVIYAASPAQTFLGAAGTILILVVLGIVGLGSALFQKNQKPIARIGIGAAGGVVMLAAVVYAIVTLTSAAAPTQSVTLNLDSKRVAEDNCGDGNTCTRYVLEATTSTNAYDFNVPREAYDKAQENTCYQFTYYANKGLFGDAAGSYQQINNVTRIETADPSACQ